MSKEASASNCSMKKLKILENEMNDEKSIVVGISIVFGSY
jgi:hypothetical protein